MIDEDEYIKEIWDKYKSYEKDNKESFYSSSVYKEGKSLNKILKMVSMFMLTIMITIGGVYAGISIYQNYIKDNSFIVADSEKMTKEWIYSNMDHIEDDVTIYYKYIMDYGDYIKYKEKLNGLEEVNETDFNENFAIIVYGVGFNIEQVNADGNDIYINYKIDYRSEEKNVSTILISKDQYKENIKLYHISETPEKGYMLIEDIPLDYTKEQAIVDGCIVAEDNKIVSNNEKLIYDFVENSKNKETDYIRIVENFEDENKIKVSDIRYKNGKYYNIVRTIYREDKSEIRYPNTEYLNTNIIESLNDKILILNFEDEIKHYKLLRF